MDPELKGHLKSKSTWIRGLYLLLFIIVTRIVEILIIILTLVQFFHKLFTGNANGNVARLGKSLSLYIADIFQFLTFHTDVRPYPFSDWPR